MTQGAGPALPTTRRFGVYGDMLRRARLLSFAVSLATPLAVACGGPDTGSDAGTSGPGTTDATTDTTTGGATSSGETPTTSGATTDASETGDTDPAPAIDYTRPGPHPVGNARFLLPAGDRELWVEVWYPADASATELAAQGHPIAEFVPAGPDRVAFEDLLAGLSPAGQIGTRLQTSSALDAAPAPGGPWPVLVSSHCFNCVRFSMFSVAERLASHGFVVAAPDHTGGTLFDKLKGDSADLGEDFLQVRRADLGLVLDAVLDANATAVPAPLRGLADPARVGVYGHSFGAATAGRLAQEDPRVRAALPIAAPVENPLFPNTHVADIHVPMLAILAEEDNSIGKLGNNLIGNNFAAQNPPAWLLRVRDAGHWNFTDICGLTADFSAGCGEGTRQTDDTAFTYLDIAIGRGIASAYTLAFFDLHLRDNAAARDYLGAPDPADLVTVEIRE